MKAWWASWPRASRTSCTGPPLCLRPAAPRARSMNSKARAAPSRAFICAMRWIWWPNAPRACCCGFGGHAMAAGCTIAEEHLDVFEETLNQVAMEWLDAATLQRRLETDGPLPAEYRRVDLVEMLHHEVWGQGFAPPVFCEEIEIVSQTLGGREAPVTQNEAPRPAGRGHLVWPHRAAACAGETGLQAGRRRVARPKAGAIFGGRRGAVSVSAWSRPCPARR